MREPAPLGQGDRGGDVHAAKEDKAEIHLTPPPQSVGACMHSLYGCVQGRPEPEYRRTPSSPSLGLRAVHSSVVSVLLLAERRHNQLRKVSVYVAGIIRRRQQVDLLEPVFFQRP